MKYLGLHIHPLADFQRYQEEAGTTDGAADERYEGIFIHNLDVVECPNQIDGRRQSAYY